VAVSRLRICDVDPYCKVKEDNNNTSTFFYLERIKFEIKVKSVNVPYQMMEMLLKKAEVLPLLQSKYVPSKGAELILKLAKV
jgi:hypothetical protein